MNLAGWLLLGWMVAAILGGVFAAWFGWHLRRYRGQHTRPHVHTRALWLVEREHSDRVTRRDTRVPIPRPRN